MIPKLLGLVAGWIVTVSQRFWMAYARALRALLIVTFFVLATPPLAQYWLSRVRFPEIPVSAIVGLCAASVFMLVVCAFLYLIVLLLSNMAPALRAATPASRNGLLGFGSKLRESGGSFIPGDDAALYEQEKIDLLKSKGILQETDVSGLASELGHRELLRSRGKTVGE